MITSSDYIWRATCSLYQSPQCSLQLYESVWLNIEVTSKLAAVILM